MNIIKDNMSYILKLFINHFVSGIYSLILFVWLTVAFDGRFVAVGSFVSILFYLFLVYSFMWEAGAKRGVGHNSKSVGLFDGAVVMCVGSLPFYVTTICSFIFSFFATGAEFAERTVDVLNNVFFYINVFFSQCMYSGLFSEIFGTIPNVHPIMYLLSLLPGLVVATFSYYIGSKNIRLRTLFGIKYNEEKEKIKNNY